MTKMSNIEKIIYIFKKKEIDTNLIVNLKPYIKKVAASFNIDLCDEEVEVLIKHFNGETTYEIVYNKENNKIVYNKYFSYPGYSQEALAKYKWLLENDPSYQRFIF